MKWEMKCVKEIAFETKQTTTGTGVESSKMNDLFYLMP